MTESPAAVHIAGRPVGPGHPVTIVAELSANHRQDLATAKALVEAAHTAGADAIKLQTYTADTMTLRSSADPFLVSGGTPWDGRSLYDLYEEACTPWDWYPELASLAEALGMHCFSTPFDATAVDFLERHGAPAHKIASFELVDLPLIACAARTGKPLILSTGMATREEIAMAVETARRAGNRELVLLKCCSAYPAPPESMHLRTIPDLSATFGVPVGISDHTLGISVPVASVALGACLIEKHLTLRRADGGPDSSFSLEPNEFAAMVAAVRTAESALGCVRYGPNDEERASLRLRRSLFAAVDIPAGTPLTEANVRCLRPSNGLPPSALPSVVGRHAAVDLAAGTPLDWALIR